MRAIYSPSSQPSDQELVITRDFDAPRSLVFQAWADPQHLVHWYGPEGFECTACEVDFRVGGKWRKCMRSPEGKDFWRWGVYRKIVGPEEIVFTYVSDDPVAQVNHETVVSLRFEDLGGKTRMHFRQMNFESTGSRDSHGGGWTSSLNRFAAYVAETAASRSR